MASHVENSTSRPATYLYRIFGVAIALAFLLACYDAKSSAQRKDALIEKATRLCLTLYGNCENIWVLTPSVRPNPGMAIQAICKTKNRDVAFLFSPKDMSLVGIVGDPYGQHKSGNYTRRSDDAQIATNISEAGMQKMGFFKPEFEYALEARPRAGTSSGNYTVVWKYRELNGPAKEKQLVTIVDVERNELVTVYKRDHARRG